LNGLVLETTDPGLAARALLAGHLAALPTETVYGLGARADLPRAIARVYAAKGRPADHPLIAHVTDAEVAWAWASEVPAYARDLADAFWPGPLTLVVPRSARAGDFITGGQSTVALRVPAHAVMQEVLRELGSLLADPAVGVAAPSANRFGRVSPTTASHVRAELADALATDDVLLDGGPSIVGVESTIVDCTGLLPVMLRPGNVSVIDVQHVTGLEVGTTSAVRAPGTLASHYAPQAQVRIVSRDAVDAVDAPDDASWGLLALADVDTPGHLVRLSAPDDADEYARVLYASLREADALGLTTVLAVAPPTQGIGAAVLDRLSRAATRA
jgi:L-threonylcarbamoyladenylate synthase